VYYENRRNYLLHLFADTVTLILVFALVVLYLYLNDYENLPDFRVHGILLVISIFCWYFSSKILKIYRRMTPVLFSARLVRLLKAVLFQTLLFSFCFLVVFPNYPYLRTFVALYLVLSLLLLVAERITVRKVNKQLHSRGWHCKKVLIVGSGARAINFNKKVIQNENNNFILSGFVDDIKQERLDGQYLGRVKDLDRILKTTEVDDVVVALPVQEVDSIVNTIKISERNAKRVRILPDYGILNHSAYTSEEHAGVPGVDVRSYPLDNFESRAMKRTFDILFSLVVILCLLSWLYPVIAILIKLGSRGPVLFKQWRSGLNNKDFLCLKFRSMRPNNKADLVSAKRDDARTTKIGRFLRKTSLDELPQFINVFFGNMSVIGPRPHMVKQDKNFADIVDDYQLRHFVKPGITGWAQVNGLRGEIKKEEDIRKRVELDMWYIENWRFDLDIQIVFQTVINMIKGDEKAF
jgi:putative colanic acid biosynthesis UDP-glucose lipid carrier transferase